MKLLLTFKRISNNKQGLSVLEPLLYMALISVISIGGVQILIGLISAEVRSNARIIQESDANTVTSWMNKRLLSDTDTVGQIVNGKTNPLSISGDQLIFETNGYCHRIAYFQENREVSIKSVTDAQCSVFDATGGPNEVTISGDLFVSNDRSPLINHPILLYRADNGAAIPVFTYYDEANEEIEVDRHADRNSTNPIYDDPQLGETIDSIRIRMIVTTRETITIGKPSDIKIDQRLYLLNN